MTYLFGQRLINVLGSRSVSVIWLRLILYNNYCVNVRNESDITDCWDR